MSKAIEDVISEKVTKSLLAGVDVDAIIAKKVGKLETVVEQLVDDAIKMLKEDAVDRVRDMLYENAKIFSMFETTVEKTIAAKLGFETKQKGNKARK